MSKSILITGGTSFFAKHFIKYLLEKKEGFERICLYSRNEYNQFLAKQYFNENKRLRWFIGDVRDKDRLKWAMNGIDTVVHAAALKRIEVGFFNPIEMVKTNIDGTINVIEAAMETKPHTVLLLSSDKAVEPRSAYGHSKAMAESLFMAANNTVPTNGPKFLITRYGNVAGSTGSIIPIWRAMKAAGKKKVPVTDPECTRFWMYAEEAVQLVYQTVLLGKPGQIAIPTLPAYRIGDLAEAMELDMEIVGLGEFEKKHESMDYGVTSDQARRMSVDELREALEGVE